MVEEKLKGLKEEESKTATLENKNIERQIKEALENFLLENAIFSTKLGKEGRFSIPKDEKEKLDLERGDHVLVVLKKIDEKEISEVTFEKVKRRTLSEILFQEKNKDLDQIYRMLNDKIEVILIAESPQSLSTYFYNADGTSSFRNKVIYTVLQKEYISDWKGLMDFIEKGFYLTDLFTEPIDEIPPKEDAVLEHKQRLVEEIKMIEPEKVLLMLPKGCFGQDEVKHRRLTYYFEEVRGKEPSDFIRTQEEMAKSLRKETGVPFEIKVAPYPNPYGKVAQEWNEREDREIRSFSDWVKKNKDWFEIEDGE